MRCLRTGMLILMLLSCASCSQSRGLPLDLQIPVHTLEQRQVWEEATGRNLQYREGLSSLFW